MLKPLRAPEICLEAVWRNGLALAAVPESLRTPELCLAAVRAGSVALQFVPEALRTPALLAVARTSAVPAVSRHAKRATDVRLEK
nr:DUF4116 domain-containing protein [Desulfovibrio sp.]